MNQNDVFRERRLQRQMLIVMAARKVDEMLGTQTTTASVSDIRVTAMGAIADARAVMFALKAKGIISEREAEDYLDQGYRSLLDQVTTASKHIFVENAGNA